MSEEFVLVYTFRNLAEASLWQERLKSEGVESRIINESGDTAPDGQIELMVKEPDAEKARKILKQVDTPPLLARPANILIYLIGGIIVVIVGILFIVQTSDLGAGIGSIVFGILLMILFFYHWKKQQFNKSQSK